MNKQIYALIQEDPQWKEVNARLEEKRKCVIDSMGTKWIMHKDNYIQKKEKKNG